MKNIGEVRSALAFGDYASLPFLIASEPFYLNRRRLVAHVMGSIANKPFARVFMGLGTGYHLYPLQDRSYPNRGRVKNNVVFSSIAANYMVLGIYVIPVDSLHIVFYPILKMQRWHDLYTTACLHYLAEGELNAQVMERVNVILTKRRRSKPKLLTRLFHHSFSSHMDWVKLRNIFLQEIQDTFRA